MLVPLVVAVGCAIDYGRAAHVHTKLLAAADAATLGSISSGSRAAAESLTMPGGGSIADGVSDAISLFNANISMLPDMQLGAVNANVGVSQGILTSTVTFAANVPTAFMNIVGIKTIPMKGTVTASIGVSPKPVYVDFYFLLDNSPSMGIAATPTEMKKLYDATIVQSRDLDGQCAFACHVTSSVAPYELVDNLAVARAAGVQLRIDQVVAATNKVILAAGPQETLPNQFRFAVYDYGATAATMGLTPIFALSADWNAAATAVQGIQLMSVKWWGDQNDQTTPHDTILPAMNSAIATPGDGSSSGSPKKYVFIISDGVSDEANPSGGCSKVLNGTTRCIQPINPALCQAFKDKGIQVGVVYTTYYSIAYPDYPITDQTYHDNVMPYNSGPFQPSTNSQIAANMQACASKGLYFEISPTMDIPAALQAVFKTALKNSGALHLQF
jgi:Putative Flp pilus-assembly TadE/G-like